MKSNWNRHREELLWQQEKQKVYLMAGHKELGLLHLEIQKLKGDRSAVCNTLEEQISRRGKTVKLKASLGMRMR